MRKKLFLALMIVGTMTSAASAQEVTVEGFGIDRDSATRDAIQIAVEQIAGTYINVTTFVRDMEVELDEIYKKSRGYVKSVKILDERRTSEGYKVRARVDVDTDPNGKLMSDLAMLYSLNDPRIAVIVFKKSSAPSFNGGYSTDGYSEGGSFNGAVEHSDIVETEMNERLMSMGFSHVVDAVQVIRQKDARLLNEIYNEREPLSDLDAKDNAVDYLVLGRLESHVEKIKVPNFRGGEELETSMNGARASLSCKVLKYGTGDLIGSFQTEGRGLNADSNYAEQLAIRSVSESAAEELSRTFKKFGSKSSVGIQMIVRASSYEDVEQLRRDLLEIQGVQSVRLREHDGNRAVLELDSTQKPNVIIQLLRQRTGLGLFIENVTDSIIRLSIN